jgi:predicted trehalose synthase
VRSPVYAAAQLLRQMGLSGCKGVRQARKDAGRWMEAAQNLVHAAGVIRIAEQGRAWLVL